MHNKYRFLILFQKPWKMQKNDYQRKEKEKLVLKV